MASVEGHASVSHGRFWRSLRFERWLNRRSPPAHSVVLSQRNIFILPTRQGVYFLGLLALVILVAINYQNSLVFAVAFLLFSLFMVSIFHTFGNLSGLRVNSGTAQPGFAGDDISFAVYLSRQGERNHEAIFLGWNPAQLACADLVEEQRALVILLVPAKHRGWLNPGRLLIQSQYPVGLFRAWSWVDLNMTAVVYPRPVFAAGVPSYKCVNPEGELLQPGGVDDFFALRDYQAGDSLRHIAWKSFARTGDLFSKTFATNLDRRVWVDWDCFPGLDRESRLSRLCYWIVALSSSSDEYGLRLPGLEIAPAKGLAHQRRLLQTLALYELQPLLAKKL